MNRLVIVLFLLLLSDVGIAQKDTINQFDDAGLKQGYWVKHHEDGSKKQRVFLKTESKSVNLSITIQQEKFRQL